MLKVKIMYLLSLVIKWVKIKDLDDKSYKNKI